MIDWGAGNYERTAAELAPVAEAVIDQARLSVGDELLDLGCGTGNAALLAAGRGARVVGVDGAARLLEVAGERARRQGIVLELRQGDLLALPVDHAAVDVVISVFGVIYAGDPAAALMEIGRVLRPGGRVLISAWIPAGPIDAMLAATGRIVSAATQAAPPARFPWSDPAAVSPLAARAGLVLDATRPNTLPIRDSSPEAYVASGQDNPMALAVRPLIARAGVEGEVTDAMTSILRDANECSEGFLVHTRRSSTSSAPRRADATPSP